METIITLIHNATFLLMFDVLYSQQWLDIMCVVHLVDGSNQGRRRPGPHQESLDRTENK